MRTLLSALVVAALSAAVSAQHGSVVDSTAGIDGGVAPDEARAVEEMLRGSGGRERHWVQRPHLVVVDTVMTFADGARSEYAAIDTQLTEAETAALVADLTTALATLSGRTFQRFASVRIETPEAGTSVRVVRNGEIVAGRFRGVRAALKAVGYGGRTSRADGTITSGVVMLDEEWDSADPQRHLLRMHELGHALGYNHVESRRSIMNATLGAEPTDFDRRVARIAFSHLMPDPPDVLAMNGR